MKGLISWWARNSVAANLLMLVCVVAGFASYFRIEKEVFPNITLSGATVSVIWPGASPEEIEEQIIFRIEEAVANVDKIKEIDSTANEGYGTVTITADDDADSTKFLNEIKSNVDGISTFPPSSYPPVTSELKYSEVAVYLAMFGTGSDVELNTVARRLRDELAVIPGGSPLVELWGEQKREISVEVSEEALRRYGLTFADVSRAITKNSINLSAGKIRARSGDIPLRTRNQASEGADLDDIVIRQNSDGGKVRVSDVATIIDGFEDNRSRRSFNGKNAILIAVRSPDKVNIVKLSKAVQEWVEETNKTLPEGYQVVTWFDTIEMYNGRINLVGWNAVSGLALVLLILFMFLHPKVAFWCAVGIGVAYAGAFIFLPITGVSLNMLSLFAFLLVTGIVVDDAIIVGESVHSMNERHGLHGLEASVKGAVDVAKPVMFAVVTTMIAFVPWLFISGTAQQYTRHISLTVIFALTFSLIESFLILPSHLRHINLEAPRGGIKAKFFRLQDKLAHSLNWFAERVYKPMLVKALRHRYLTILGFWSAMMLSIAVVATGWVSFNFMPKVDSTFLRINIVMPEGSPYARNLQIYEKTLASMNEARAEMKNAAGENIIRHVYMRVSQQQIILRVTIIDADQRELGSREIIEQLREYIGEVPDAEKIESFYTFGREDADLVHGIESKSSEALRVASEDMQRFFADQAGVYDVRDSASSSLREMRLQMKESAERYGVDLFDVTSQLRQAYYGDEAQRLPSDGADIRVMVRYPEATRDSIDSIENFRVRTTDGRLLPLSSVADFTFAPSMNMIERSDRRRTVTVLANLRTDADEPAIRKKFQEEFLPVFMQSHPDVRIVARGEAKDQGEFLQEFLILYVIAIFVMYALLAIAFGSYSSPILVLTAIPFGYMGAMFGHLLFGVNLAMFSFFGIAAAGGVVVNDNLVLINYLNQLRAQNVGAFMAIVRSGVERFRPIVLTSITTFVGLLPIMLQPSTDARFLMPTIVSLAFGVMFATPVTLVFVPCVYSVGIDIKRTLHYWWTGKKEQAFGATTTAADIKGVS